MTQLKKAKALQTLSTLLVVAAMVLAFLIAGMRFLGFDVYGVLSGSMVPAYPVGSMIYVKPVDSATLRVNDVITFSLSANTVVTHRIVEIVPDDANPAIVRYRTKGDANSEADNALVPASSIIGKVSFSVPGLGYLANYIQQPPGIYVAILVGLAIIGFVFYADSLESRLKKSAPAQGKPASGMARRVNTLWLRCFGKPLLRQPPQPAPPQYYAPQPYQQPYYGQQQYPPQQYPQQQPYQPPYYGQPQQYPPQQYPQQQPYQQPYYGQPQQYPQQQYPQQQPYYGQPPQQQQVMPPLGQQGYRPQQAAPRKSTKRPPSR